MRRSSSARRGWRLRPLAAFALVLGVSGLHLSLAHRVAQNALGFGAAQDAGMQRIELAFVKELQVAATPQAAAPVRAAAAQRAVVAVAGAASAVQQAAQREEADAAPVSKMLDEPSPGDAPAATEAQAAAANAASQAQAQAQAASEGSDSVEAEAADAASGSDSADPGIGPTAFDWPPSTRLSYTLTGHYQGPVDGQAQVEWLRSGMRYQVHLDVSVGPSFAPLMRRRMSSEGQLSSAGLQPQRYEEHTRVLWAEPRRAQMQFEGDAVALANGQRVGSLPGLQDTASQFVQLTWLFTTQPQRLAVGQQIDLPLALPRRVGVWRYEVKAEEELDTPFGRIPVLHLKPLAGSGRPGELLAEAWFAPSLQYLPVRLRIHQDAQTWIDLRVDRLPLQAAPQVRR